MTASRVAVVVSHPVQHFCPQYASWARVDRAQLKVFFASSAGLKPYEDEGFGQTVQWEDLNLDSFPHHFLNGGAALPVTPRLDAPDAIGALSDFDPHIVVSYGYIHPFQRRVQAWVRKRGNALLAYISDSERRQRRPLHREVGKYLPVAWNLRRPHVFLTVGDANEEYYRFYRVHQPMVRMHFPIAKDLYAAAYSDREKLRSSLRSALGIGPDEFVVACVGKLVHRKRQRDLVLGSVRGDFRVLLAGTGEDEDALRAIAGDKVHFLGFVSPQRLPAVYAASDVYAHPAELEPHSIAISEAIYMGCPVVLSDRCGSYGPTDDVVDGYNGFVYPTGDVSALLRAIGQLRNDAALRAAFARRSHDRATGFQDRAHGTALRELMLLAGWR